MVVEDEPPILRSIAGLIESLDPGFQVVARAYDGEEAIALLEDSQIDVLFTDIRMPVVDGLELLNHVKQFYPCIIPVVISGHQEFEYAKKAIQFGVVDYILKPVAKNALAELLTKIAADLTAKRHEAEMKYIDALLNGDFPEGHRFKPDPENSQFQLLIFCAGPFPNFVGDYLNPAKQFWERNDLRQLFEKLHPRLSGIWLANGKSNAEKFALLAFAEDHEGAMNQFKRCIHEWLAATELPVTVVSSAILPRIEAVSQEARKLRLILQQRVIIGASQLIKADEQPPVNATREAPLLDSFLERRLHFSIEHRDLAMFESNLQQACAAWQALKCPQIQVEKMLHYLITLCQRSLPSAANEASFPEMSIREAITYSANYEELF